MYVLRLKRRTNLLKVSVVAVAAMLAACLLALEVRVQPSQAAFPGHNGKIAFERWQTDGDWEVYTVNADGSSETDVSNNAAGIDRAPAWSPDGNKIAFWSSRDGDGEIFVMNPDGSKQTNISRNSVGDFQPAWSPDGTKIAFTSYESGTGDIYTINADGSNQTNLTNNHPTSDKEPDWSPDGIKITFTSGRDGILNIYTMNADGSNVTPLTDYSRVDMDPEWQPITASTNTAPTITSLRPVPSSSTTDRTPTIAATVTDQQTNLAKSNITLVLDDVTIPRTAFSYNQATDRMSYTPAKNLSLGSHAVKVIARDGSGLSTTRRWSFEIVHP